jgi:spermidine synthase
VLYETESLYHYLRVTQTGSVRRLQFRRSGADYDESAIDLADPQRFPLQYYARMLAGFAHQPDPKTVLFVGLGGGTLPMMIHDRFPAATIDAVELDPEVVVVAKRFFGLREDARLRVHVRDGRVQVRRFLRADQKYDLIFLDAFRGGYIPYHLTTREFLHDIAELLTPNGIVVSNLCPGFESYHYQRRTYAAVFRNEWSYDGGGNVIVITDQLATPLSTAQLAANAERLQREKRFRVDLPAIVRAGSAGGDYQRRGRILTDDYAPTDVLRGIRRD